MTDRRRHEQLDWRAKGTVVACVVLPVGMVLLGMNPRVVLVVCIVVIVSAAAWLVADLGAIAAPVSWQDYGSGSTRSARPDRRVRALRSRLRRDAHDRRRPGRAGRADETADEIGDTLLLAIDDHLRSELGIDRSARPDAAAAALGPELTSFVADVATRRTMTRPRSLATTVTMIEALTKDAR